MVASIKKVVFTGGGTAGHVTPNMALITECLKKGWIPSYIGSKDGVEKTMITEMGIKYYGIRCGKLRRYLSFKNFLDPFNIIWGILQSLKLLNSLKPNIVFSKGGFVAFPVVLAAWMLRIPVIAHESDLTPGLANRLSFPFVKKICVTFDLAKTAFKNQNKVMVTGTPIREALFQGDRLRGLTLCAFTETKPCILVMGGGQGSAIINNCIRDSWSQLSKNYQIIHLCGKGQLDEKLAGTVGYYQQEFANETLADLLAASDIVISRAGANSLYELLALEKPHILIPLSRRASRGDQLQNAAYFQKKNISHVIFEEELTSNKLIESVSEVRRNAEKIIADLRVLQIDSATTRIIQIIEKFAL